MALPGPRLTALASLYRLRRKPGDHSPASLTGSCEGPQVVTFLYRGLSHAVGSSPTSWLVHCCLLLSPVLPFSSGAYTVPTPTLSTHLREGSQIQGKLLRWTTGSHVTVEMHFVGFGAGQVTTLPVFPYICKHRFKCDQCCPVGPPTGSTPRSDDARCSVFGVGTQSSVLEAYFFPFLHLAPQLPRRWLGRKKKTLS